MTDSTKSDIKWPVAKRFMVVFVTVLLIGLIVDIVHHSDLGDFLSGVGLVGFLASAVIASEVKIASRIEDIKTSVGELFGWVGIILSGILYIALGLGLLWGIIAILKWMWMHS